MQNSPPVSPPLLEQPSQAAHARHGAHAQARTQWVDVARGLGIVLVVFGHAMGGVITGRMVAPDGPWWTAFYLLYTFHMPLFFFLAGLFVQARLQSNPGGFVQTAFTRVAWPYLLWSVIQLLVIASLGRMVNKPIDVSTWRLVSLLWEPTSQFWFLHSLLTLHLLSRWLVPRIGPLAVLSLLLLARGMVEWIEWTEWVELPSALVATMRMGLFYGLGVWAGPVLLRMAGRYEPAQVGRVAAVAATVWAVAAVVALWSGHTYSSLTAMPAALAGGVALITVALLSRGGSAAAWGALGRASMSIFLLHVLFVAGTRIVLNKLLGVDNVGLIVLLASLVGIAGPLVLHELARRAGASRVLGLA